MSGRYRACRRGGAGGRGGPAPARLHGRAAGAAGSLVAAAAAAAWGALAVPVAAQAPPPTWPQRVDKAVDSATRFLLAQVGPDGRCQGECPPTDPRFGGRTALCVHALLTAALSPQTTPPLQQAILWLRGAKLHGTYAVSFRAVALAMHNDPQSLAVLQKDTSWLVRAMDAGGGYTYTSSDGQPAESPDNSNAQIALLGVWAGASRGAEVPLAYWQRAEKYWLWQQQLDGGWGYRLNPRTGQARSYGSMTAAGLASLYICYDSLRADQFIQCTAAGEDQPMTRGLEWLARNFRPDENPRKGVEWHHYWLYCLARVGLASGHKHFGQHDWYAQGAGELLTRQNPDGSWGDGDRLVETAFALVFLVRGRHPLLMSKLHYLGKWNARPRDAANLAAWLSLTFERPLVWQVVAAEAPLADWHEAPILYISGAGPVEFTDEQVDRLRAYALQGGLILSEAACNNGDFTLDMRGIYRRMFPSYPLMRLPADHPIYSAHSKGSAETWLSGVSNGVRLLAVHAPRELSLAMQLGPRKTHMPIYDLLANVYQYATDRGSLRPRGVPYWPAAEKAEPKATIRLARLRHAGNCDPEPLAWQRMAILLLNRHRVRLDVSPLVSIGDLDAARWPIAHMTGTEPFALSPAEKEALVKYLRAGGTLIADAAGGTRPFADAFRNEVEPLLADGQAGQLIQDHPLYLNGPYELRRFRYRRDYALSLGDERALGRLRVVTLRDRLAVIFSREDLTAGLVGYPAFKLAGYEPQTAEQLMTNILFHAGGIRAR